MSGEEENNPAPNAAQTDEVSADSEKQSNQDDNTGNEFLARTQISNNTWFGINSRSLKYYFHSRDLTY